MDQVVLASQSPQRLQICKRLGLSPIVVDPDIDETPVPSESASDLVLRLALAKAEAVSGEYSQHIIIAGDSVVELEGKILGKPAGRDEAREMLISLSGMSHRVVSMDTWLCKKSRQ